MLLPESSTARTSRLEPLAYTLRPGPPTLAGATSHSGVWELLRAYGNTETRLASKPPEFPNGKSRSFELEDAEVEGPGDVSRPFEREDEEEEAAARTGGAPKGHGPESGETRLLRARARPENAESPPFLPEPRIDESS